MAKPTIQRALISTANKTGLVDFAQQLNDLGIAIIATGGTAQLLSKSKIPVTEVAEFTGFPELMEGRVKTLHPKIHGGLLGRRGVDDNTMKEHDIQPIDLLVVNLYPFQQTIAKPDCTFAQAIEQIDIGGPTMLRAAAKNHRDVTVVVDPSDYSDVLAEIKQQGNTIAETRRKLAHKTFQHTAIYDRAIANYFSNQLEKTENKSIFPQIFTSQFDKILDLRYGENPHQQAAFYRNSYPQPASLAEAILLQGKSLSFNNLLDSNAALSCVRGLNQNQPACVIIKHATPCGVAQGKTLLRAYQKAHATDPVSSFGGIIAVNKELDAETAQTMINQQFIEVLLTPSVAKDAVTILQQKPNLRVLICDQPSNTDKMNTLHSISGGLLVQQNDCINLNLNEVEVVSHRPPTESEMRDLTFAWQAVKFVKSNAIVYAKDQATLGIGSGQTSRVFSAKIAALKASEAKLELNNAVMASDAFFPFADGIEVAAKAGIKAVIQPGGSKRDAEVIAAADEAGMAMVFTGIRHFRH